MPAILLKLIPFRDWLYAGIAIAAITFYNVHVHNLEVAYANKQTAAVAASVQAATQKDEAAAQAKINSLNAQHAQDVAKVQATYEATIKQNAATHDADVARLRQLAEKNGSGGDANKVLDSASGSGQVQAPSGGDQSIVGLGSVPAGLALELADALRTDDAALNKCWNDRDSLTGK
jgi:hypothetical protein